MTPLSAEEEVVLVDEENNVLGTMPKSLVHGSATPLHRGFSLFLFDRNGQLLLQRRGRSKKTWPLIWSNTICGHPAPHETNVEAAERRLSYELGMRASHIEEIAPYRYRFTHDGVMENEVCPILVGFSDDEPKPNPEEVEAVRRVAWPEFLRELDAKEGVFSEWCVEEARILAKHPRFRELFEHRDDHFHAYTT